MGSGAGRAKQAPGLAPTSRQARSQAVPGPSTVPPQEPPATAFWDVQPALFPRPRPAWGSNSVPPPPPPPPDTQQPRQNSAVLAFPDDPFGMTDPADTTSASAQQQGQQPPPPPPPPPPPGPPPPPPYPPSDMGGIPGGITPYAQPMMLPPGWVPPLPVPYAMAPVQLPPAHMVYGPFLAPPPFPPPMWLPAGSAPPPTHYAAYPSGSRKARSRAHTPPRPSTSQGQTQQQQQQQQQEQRRKHASSSTAASPAPASPTGAALGQGAAASPPGGALNGAQTSPPGQPAAAQAPRNVRTRLSQEVAAARGRLEALFPRLPAPLPLWLLRCCVEQKAERLGGGNADVGSSAAGAAEERQQQQQQQRQQSRLVVSAAAAEGVFAELGALSDKQLAARCSEHLLELQSAYLAGCQPWRPVQVLVQDAGFPVAFAIFAEEISSAALVAAALQLVADKSASTPRLAEGGSGHSAHSALALPPPAPPPELAIPPAALQPYSRDSPQLRSLVAEALERWGGSCGLAHAPAARGAAQAELGLAAARAGNSGPAVGSGGSGGGRKAGQLGLVVGPSVDFGLQQLVHVPGEVFRGVAATVAAQFGSAAAAGVQQQQQQQQNGGVQQQHRGRGLASSSGRAGSGSGAEGSLQVECSLLDLLQLMPEESPAGNDAPSQNGGSSTIAGSAAAAATATPSVANGGSAGGSSNGGSSNGGNNNATNDGTTGSRGVSGNTTSSSSSSSQPASMIKLRAITIHNESAPGGCEVWVLGGVAAPQLPHTFAVLDDARLFLADSRHAVKLVPGATHTLTLALSTADGRHRREESGLLSQLLLLILAVPAASPAAACLEGMRGTVAVADVGGLSATPTAAGTDSGAADQGSTGAAAAAAPVASASEGALAPAEANARGSSSGASAGFRVFVVGRQATVALVQRAGEVRKLLSVEAPPYVPEPLRRVFAAPPELFLSEVSVLHKKLSLPPPIPAHQQFGRAVAQQAEGATGLLAVPDAGQLPPGSSLGELELAVKFRRLLLLEELAMEQAVCRHDLWNVRLRLAVFRGGSDSWFELWEPSPAGTGVLEPANGRRGGVYRGPSIEWLQPKGVGQFPTGGRALRLLCQLEVPGLAEGRPTVVVGDTVYIRTAKEPSKEIPAALVSVEGSSCYLLMPPTFWFMLDVAPLVGSLAVGGDTGKCGGAPGTAFDGLVHVRFSFDRGPLISMHTALESSIVMLASCPCRLLPPSEGDRQHPSPPQMAAQPATEEVIQEASQLQERGSQRLNAEQRMAVAAVVLGGGRAMPYALFGPPGTGKTVTLVECALQLLAAHPSARLLLCAPQNYSADLLCSALAAAGVDSKTMLRMNDPRRPAPQVKADVVRYCLFDEQDLLYKLPSPQLLNLFRVVVATCAAAGLLQGQTFTHVLIDEAGQALLPEALIPLSLLRPPPPPAGDPSASAPSNSSTGTGTAMGTVPAVPAESPIEAGALGSNCRGWGAVLCGDPQQLGPVVHSPAAAATGLGTSLLERWIGCHAAAAHEYEAQGAAAPTIQLVRNYRSHRRLLDLPSRLFYKGSLLAAADPASVLAPAWEELYGAARDLSSASTASSTSSEAEEAQHLAPAGEGDLSRPVTTIEGGQAAVAGQEEEAGRREGKGGLLGEADGRKAAADAGAHDYTDDYTRDYEDDYSDDYGSPAAPLANLLFWGVMGEQRREGEAPSFFNPLEASVVVELIQGLLGSGAGVVPDHIGVMATYRKQVQKIRLLLRERGLGAIRVGTLDDYQGQEERIIFISTTLSRPESLPPSLQAPSSQQAQQQQAQQQQQQQQQQGRSGDANNGGGSGGNDGHLGFWRNPKRFNVAITRAKALLVVVGHPLVLLQDANWRELLSYCITRGVYRGAGASFLQDRLGLTGDDEQEVEEEDGSSLQDGTGGGSELRHFIQEMAEKALLGLGDADLTYPSTLEQYYDAYADEMPSRVML